MSGPKKPFAGELATPVRIPYTDAGNSPEKTGKVDLRGLPEILGKLSLLREHYGVDLGKGWEFSLLLALAMDLVPGFDIEREMIDGTIYSARHGEKSRKGAPQKVFPGMPDSMREVAAFALCGMLVKTGGAPTMAEAAKTFLMLTDAELARPRNRTELQKRARTLENLTSKARKRFPGVMD